MFLMWPPPVTPAALRRRPRRRSCWKPYETLSTPPLVEVAPKIGWKDLFCIWDRNDYDINFDSCFNNLVLNKLCRNIKNNISNFDNWFSIWCNQYLDSECRYIEVRFKMRKIILSGRMIVLIFFLIMSLVAISPKPFAISPCATSWTVIAYITGIAIAMTWKKKSMNWVNYLIIDNLLFIGKNISK